MSLAHHKVHTTHHALYYLILFFLNWSIIVLQYCVSFCCTTKWISYKYTKIHSFLSLPPTIPSLPPSPSLPSRFLPYFYLLPLTTNNPCLGYIEFLNISPGHQVLPRLQSSFFFFFWLFFGGQNCPLAVQEKHLSRFLCFRRLLLRPSPPLGRQSVGYMLAQTSHFPF